MRKVLKNQFENRDFRAFKTDPTFYAYPTFYAEPTYVLSTGADFCYRTGTTAECVKDASSNTQGLLYATCDGAASTMSLTLNEACRSGDYGFMIRFKIYSVSE